MHYIRLAADNPRRVAAGQLVRDRISLIEAALEGADTIVPSMFTAADMQLAFYPGGD